MSLEVRQEGAFIDIYNKDKDVALARVPAIESESGKDEFYILDGDWSPIRYDNSDEVVIPTPYFDIEQALDDFEYMTKKIPTDIIKDFKERINKSNTLINSRKVSEKMKETKTSDRSELFFLNRDDGFFSLLHAPTGYQLNFSPASETASGEDEFSITTEDFEPIENYEVLARTFTNDFSEALSEFEGIVGNVPQTVVTDFVNKSFMETSAEKDEFVVIDEDGKVLSFVDENNLDFLDTVDDIDGGYEKAYKFSSPEEAKEAMERVELDTRNLVILPVSEAFAFVNETSAKHKVYEDNDPRLENGVVVIDQDGKVLTYLTRFTYDFLDTVDDEDGGFNRAVIFQDEEQARNASSSFENIYDDEGDLIGRHEWEVIPVKEAFDFVNTSANRRDFEIGREGNFVDIFNKRNGVVLSYLPAEETITGVPEFSIMDTNYKPIRKFERFAEGITDFDSAWEAFEKLYHERIPDSIKEDFKNAIGITTSDITDLGNGFTDLGNGYYIFQPEDINTPYQLSYDLDSQEVSVEYFDEEHDDEDTKVFSIDDDSIYDFVKDLYSSADMDELKRAIESFRNLS